MRKLLLITLLIAFSGILFAQESVYFAAFETINVNYKHQYVTSKLFKNYVDTHGKYTITLPTSLNSSQSEAYLETLSETKSNALKYKTTYYIVADMSAIGNLLIVNMKMYNTVSGQLVWSDALKANQLEDLDPVVQLFAKALGTEESAVNAGDIYSVTQYDSKELNKRQATESWAFSVGGGAILASEAKDPGIAGFGIMKSYDIRDLILDIKAELYFGEETGAQRIGLNLLKPLSDKDFSLFYGGGMYYGGMYYLSESDQYSYHGYYDSQNSNSGLELEGNFGVIFNRLSSVQLRATVTPVFGFYKINDKAVGSIRFGVTATF